MAPLAAMGVNARCGGVAVASSRTPSAHPAVRARISRAHAHKANSARLSAFVQGGSIAAVQPRATTATRRTSVVRAAQAVTVEPPVTDEGDGDNDDVPEVVVAEVTPIVEAPLNGASNGSTPANGVAKPVKVAVEVAKPAKVQSVATAPSGGAKKNKAPVVAKGAGRWGNLKTMSTFQRTFEIWSFAFVFLIKQQALKWKFTYRKMGGMTDENIKTRKEILANWLREGLLRLGPTFIKIGQQFSTRVDVLAPEYIKELEKLQDNVPPFPTATALQIVEADFGRPANEVFDEFDETPIAAASLGQVHKARLNGQQVVVKVQRPGLKELFDIDLKNLRVIAAQLQKIDPKTDGAARDWVAIYDECARILYEEIDYTNEGRNADRFRECFKNDEWIKVPKIDWEYTSTNVLTMEYCPGIKINNINELDRLGLDKKRLARLSVESYLQQILTHGFFHADPHPGNISVDPADGGKLIIYDFGMMGEIKPGVREGLLGLFYGVYKKDADSCLDSLVQMGVLVPTGDMTAVRRTASFFLKSFDSRLKGQSEQAEELGEEYNKDYKPQRTKEEKKAKRKEILSNIGEDLLSVAADQPFRFPATFTFVVRAFSVLDGIGKGLDPKFDISEISRPYAMDLLLESSSSVDRAQRQLKKGLERNNKALLNLWQGGDKIDKVSNVIERMEQGELKLRVRALEAERGIARMEIMQKATTQAILAASLVNVGTVLSVSAVAMGATLSFSAAGVFGFMALGSLLKVKKLKKKELQITGQA